MALPYSSALADAMLTAFSQMLQSMISEEFLKRTRAPNLEVEESAFA
jgi:hypothetical protein